LKQNNKNSLALDRAIDLGSGKSSENGANKLCAVNNTLSRDGAFHCNKRYIKVYFQNIFTGLRTIVFLFNNLDAYSIFFRKYPRF